jgi:epoxyqueuosine reductase
MQSEAIKEAARRIGFDAAGIAPVALLSEEVEHVRRWVREGKHAGMGYMERNEEVREDVRRLVPGAHSVIVTLTNYYDPRPQPAGVPRIAMYARGRDYHAVLKERLHALLREIRQKEPEAEGRCFVDSAPLLEHAWARRAGLGWQGKNTLLIRKGLGSFCFIGTIITTTRFDRYDTPFTANHCGTCRRCVDACPTGALQPGSLDARRCISYQTIENKEDCPDELLRLAGERLFGCDACQMACPWNARLTPHRTADFLPQGDNMELTAADWLAMSPEQFRERFRGSPLERAGLLRLQKIIAKNTRKRLNNLDI